MTTTKNNAPTTRQYRMGELVKRALADIVLRLDLTIPSFTITQVSMSPDLRFAHVYFLCQDTELNNVHRQLRLNARDLQYCLKDYLAARYLPKLKFFPDNSLEQVELIEQLLKTPQVARDLSDK